MSARETTRLHLPYPGLDDQGTWDSTIVTMMAQLDTRIFANIENLKPVYAALPTVLNDAGSGELQQTGDWVLVSRTFHCTITVPTGSTLPLVAGTMIGVRLTAGAVSNQVSAWETVPNGADVDAEFQVFGYVDSGLTITWYNGVQLAVGESAPLFSASATSTTAEDADLVVGGGLGLVLTGDVLTWATPITVRSPRSAGTITIAAGSVGVMANEFVYVVPSVRPITTEAGTLLAAATVPDGAIALGARLGNQVLLRNNRTQRFERTVANGTAVTTGSAASGGGTTQGSVYVGVSAGCFHGLRVVAAGNTVLSTIELFVDSARTDRIYLASGKDCYTSPYHVDRTPWMIQSFDNNLVDGILYYTITNNGANDSTYTIEVVGEGRV